MKPQESQGPCDKSATVAWWQGKGCEVGDWACSDGSGPEVVIVQSADELFISARTRIKCSYPHHSNLKLAFSLQHDRCVAVRRALKWSIHLYDGLTYLWVLADLLLPIPTTSKWCLETTWNTPPSPSRWQNADIFTISSWKANLAAAGRDDCQQQLVPIGPCADKLCFILKLQSEVSWRRRGDIYKVIWLFLFDTVHWSSLHTQPS